MKTCYFFVLCVTLNSFTSASYSDEESEVQESCCTHGETFALKAPSAAACADADVPGDVDSSQLSVCKAAVNSCCKKYFKNKEECTAAFKFAEEKRCSVPRTEIGKTCCEECSFGTWTGESQGRDSCSLGDDEAISPLSALRTYAYTTCCVKAAEKPSTTTEPEIKSTTETLTTTTLKREVCKKDSCDHLCNDEDGKVRCSCREGYRLQSDKKTCKDINECAEAIDDLCIAEGTVCHNTAGSFMCVPFKKREVGLTCPPGFKRNLKNQVCDDINECQLPRPPCPKYLCENTIGGYKCGGKAGTPYFEAVPGKPTEPPATNLTSPKNDICPPGFRSGPDDECIDIDECDERLDDCQRLSQYCINTHGGFFCQDHVSKRCSPGFKANTVTGKCEDIDECEESMEVCKRTEVCVNLPGAYNCKSKISTLPKLATKTCQEGMRLKPGGTICEDIDECREGTHLCDRFQNCINTYGGHECRCKNGFELDSTSGSCVDIDECALKLDNCAAGLHCLNVLGAFTCTRRAPTPAPAPTTTPSSEDYYYYDSEEDNSTSNSFPMTSPTSTITSKPNNLTPPKPSTNATRRTNNNQDRPRYPQPVVPATVSTEASTTTTESPEETRSEPPVTVPRPSYNPRPSYTPRRPETPPKPAESPRRPEMPARPRPPPSMPELPPRPTEPPRRPETPPIPAEPHRRPEYAPRPMDRPRRPDMSPRRPEPPTEVSVPPPENPDLIEKDNHPDGSYGLNTSDIPKDRWTNFVGRDKPETEPDFDINNLHCLHGFERDARGNCVDMDECVGDRHICSSLEMCVNMDGGYRCDCIPGFDRDKSGWCVPTSYAPSNRSNTPYKPDTHLPNPATTRTTSTSTTTTTERTTTEVVPYWRPPPAYSPRRPETPRRTPCEMGYTFNISAGRCVDIDECAIRNTCSSNEDCYNVEGGYYCQCGVRCRAATERPAYEPVQPREYEPSGTSPTDVVTVGTQYGQRGPRQRRPSFSRLPNTGAIVTACPWGYKLTPEKMCYDIDECAKNVSMCGPQQRCENFYGGYSCQCPAGHRVHGKDGCLDIDECTYGSPCSYNSKCVNTVGSYRCECGAGFRNSPSNDKMCVDVDECAESPHACHQLCANAWGSYRCYCKRGYRLDTDNRTCVDIDECAEWSAVRARGRLCGGDCVNEQGSYRCSCPDGYRLGEDGKSCIDVDECETGQATCAAAQDPGEVCQNTRGGYHCHRIHCPVGYALQARHRCTRIQRSCPISDWGCQQQPSAYTYNFITFVANIFLPTGSVDLFTMHGPSWPDAVASFELRMLDVQAPAGVRPADLRCFDMRPMDNVCVISLLCSLGGPQVAELELTMSLYQHGRFAGNAAARLVIIVSQYEF